MRRVQRVDGTRDRPPGKTAQNWSRKDGIRAGSVSGPWRSAPREAGATPAPTPLSPPGRRGWQAQGAAPQVTLDYLRARKRRGLGMAAWIGFGVLAAGAIVAAAVLFRPEPAPPVPPELSRGVDAAEIVAPRPEAVPAGATARPAASQRVPSDPALAGVTTVRLRIGPDFPAERQTAILAALSEAGVPAIRVEPLPFRIATSRVGYYRAPDLGAAEALGRLISPVIGEGAEIGVRDYSQLLADPEPGRLDLWVGG